jgi:hypothetical protein
MSLIFQLFRADYLAQLDHAALDALRQHVRQLFDVRQYVDLRRNTILRDSPLVTPQHLAQVIEKIRQRALVVWQQLGVQPPPTIVPAPFNLALPLFGQLFGAGELNRLTPHQRDILETAITCEITNFNSYVYLLIVKEEMDTIAMRLHPNGARPSPPDTDYSPFKPGSPLRTLYNP